MSTPIRFELSGKQAESWNSVFDTLTTVITGAVNCVAADAKPHNRRRATRFAKDIAKITKGWVQAKLTRPAIDNELAMAEIALRFEELKKTVAQREQIEVATERDRIALEKDRLELWEKRMAVALKWLGFLTNHVIKEDDGTVTLVLSNSDLSGLLKEVRMLTET